MMDQLEMWAASAEVGERMELDPPAPFVYEEGGREYPFAVHLVERVEGGVIGHGGVSIPGQPGQARTRTLWLDLDAGTARMVP